MKFTRFYDFEQLQTSSVILDLGREDPVRELINYLDSRFPPAMRGKALRAGHERMTKDEM